jgi:hypothetical protein
MIIIVVRATAPKTAPGAQAVIMRAVGRVVERRRQRKPTAQRRGSQAPVFEE